MNKPFLVVVVAISITAFAVSADSGSRLEQQGSGASRLIACQLYSAQVPKDIMGTGKYLRHCGFKAGA